MAGSGGASVAIGFNWFSLICVEPLRSLRNHRDISAPPTRPTGGSDPWGWDGSHVRMPCSPHNVGRNGRDRWQQISTALGRTFYRGGYELGDVIKSYNTKHSGGWRFQGLEEFSNQNAQLFSKVVPEIIHLALELPKVITQPIPILKAGQEGSVTLSQTQLASLLANAFLCTFPWRNEPSQSQSLPTINFSNLFAQRDASAVEKIKCIFHYFERVSKEMPKGKVTFTRRVLKGGPDWRNSTRKLLSLDPTDRGSIEENGRGMLQVDFANKVIGGGVLGRGAVQEEIRFALSPELIVSRLFTEELQDNEALVITGSERFSAYSGYAQSFRFAGDFEDKTPYDGDGRRRCSIVAIDAIHFRNSDDQHKKHYIDRELKKAYVGFHLEGGDRNQLSPVATGNWGCGAFNGDPQLKTLLQWLAASEAERSLHYFTYGDKALADNTRTIMGELEAFGVVTVGDLYRKLESLPPHRSDSVFVALRKAIDPEQNVPAAQWNPGTTGHSGQAEPSGQPAPSGQAGHSSHGGAPYNGRHRQPGNVRGSNQGRKRNHGQGHRETRNEPHRRNQTSQNDCCCTIS